MRIICRIIKAAFQALLLGIPATAFSQEFSVATLNVDGLPDRVLFFKVNSDGPGKRYTPAIGSILLKGQYDFIGVQENFDFSEDLFSVLDTAYFHDEWQGGVRHGGTPFHPFLLRLETDGLNGFWKHGPVLLEDETAIKWKVSRGKVKHANDGLVHKGFRRYDLILYESGRRFVVYNLHMDASDDQEELTGADLRDQKVRLKQWAQLRDHILEHLDSRPIIVMGDMNTFYTHDPVQELFFDSIAATGKAMAHDVFVELQCGGTFPAYREGPVAEGERDSWMAAGECLDKILYINPVGGQALEPLSYQVIKESFLREDRTTPLGDHYPISAVFRFVP